MGDGVKEEHSRSDTTRFAEFEYLSPVNVSSKMCVLELEAVRS